MTAIYRKCIIATLCVTLIWMSRLPLVVFGYVRFSYLVYAAFLATAAVYVLRLFVEGRSSFRVLTRPWLWFLITAVAVAALRGTTQVGDIPPWVLTPDQAEYTSPWIYFRAVALPPLLLLVLAMFIAAGVSEGQNVRVFEHVAVAYLLFVSVLIVGDVWLAPESITTLAQSDFRSQHLTNLGFHPNEFGAMLTVGYALLLGSWEHQRQVRIRSGLSVALPVIAIAIVLTFSRGAYLAFAVVNVLFFLKGSPATRSALLVLAVVVWLLGPAAVSDRIRSGWATGDLNVVSAGRIEYIWGPLTTDIAEHWAFGQGLNSIMWTDAQRLRLIAPVTVAHNGYLDLLLDVGVVGTIVVVGCYLYLWRSFLKQTREDRDAAFRRFFYGGHLAMVGWSICAVTSIRLTPGAETCLLWVAAGVLLGRMERHRMQVRPAVAVVTTRRLSA